MGTPLPEILTKPPPTRLDEDGPIGLRAQEEEIERLRARNRQLEEQIRMAQNQIAHTTDLIGQTGKGNDDRMIQNKFYNEMQLLKGENGGQRLASRGQNADLLRKERNDLQEENRRLITLVRIGIIWEGFILYS